MTSPTRRSASPATKTPTKPVKTAPKSKAKPKPKAKPKTPRTLTDRVRVFIAEYAKDRNGTQAAIRAGYSPKTAQVQSADILSRPMVRAAVDEMMARIETKCELSAERTLREVARIAYFDPRRLFNDNGDPLPLHALDDDTAAAIQGVEVLEEWEGQGDDRRKVGEVKKYKVADKNAALDKAMKHHGLYKADNTQAVDALGQFMAELSAQGSRLPIKKGGSA